MKRRGVLAAMAGLCVAALLWGCGGGDGGGAAADEQPPWQAGADPVDTLRVYYFYRDRGSEEALLDVVTAESAGSIRDLADRRIPRASQLKRDMIVDHKWERERETRIYYRTWNSDQSKEKGGWPRVAMMYKQNDEWRIGLIGSLKATLVNTKGKTSAGFYDGTKRWWK